jgi:hypothetical protein
MASAKLMWALAGPIAAQGPLPQVTATVCTAAV